MHPTYASTRLIAAVAAVVLALAPGAAIAANDSAAGDSASPAIVLAGLERAEQPFIPGVTDSGTGVLRELERQSQDRFIPGVTDSGTGVLRELERRTLEGREAPTASADDSGFGAGPAAVAAGAALAAAAVAGALALAAAARDRHIAT